MPPDPARDSGAARTFPGMQSSGQDEGDARTFLSQAFTTDRQAPQKLAAAQVEATLAVAAALTEFAAVIAAGN